MEKTYREKLQQIIHTLWDTYDKVGALRDSGYEKEPFNSARSALYSAAITLGAHDDALTDDQARAT